MVSIYRAGEADFSEKVFAGSSCAFGVFDGVHMGHKYLLDCACAGAREEGGTSIALTFDIDPDEMFHSDRLKKLTSNEDRIAALAKCGVDAVVVLPFTREFAARGPEEFLEHTFAGYAPAQLHVGSDFRFGARAAGTVADLQAWGNAVGTRICAHHLVSADGAPITATRIRLLLLEGKVAEAKELLGYPYTLHDVVHPGRQDGRAFGFRTANLEVDAMRRVVGEGVYAGYALSGGKRYRAAIAVGVSPMFEASSSATCEVHLLDFDQEIYGQDLYVEFHEWLRPMIRFASTEELVETVMGNIAWVRENLPL